MSDLGSEPHLIVHHDNDIREGERWSSDTLRRRRMVVFDHTHQSLKEQFEQRNAVPFIRLRK